MNGVRYNCQCGETLYDWAALTKHAQGHAGEGHKEIKIAMVRPIRHIVVDLTVEHISPRASVVA